MAESSDKVATPPQQESQPPVVGESAKTTEGKTGFGSSTFGGSSGFGGFATATQSTPTPTTENGTGEGEENADEEDCSAEFAPVVQLNEVETVSGEEAENTLVDFKCKLYRFENNSGEWKERGVGQVRLLESKENSRIRLLHRQEKTLKIRANHILMPGTKLQEHSGSEKAWVWSAVDFADEVQRPELFCIRFASVERAQEFKKSFDEAVAKNTELLGEDPTAEEEQTQNASPEKSPEKSPADELTEKTEKLAVKEEGTKEDDEEK